MSPPPLHQPIPIGLPVGAGLSPQVQLQQGMQQYSLPIAPTQQVMYVHPMSVQHSSSGTVPAVQPMPIYETPSAFPGPSPPTSSTVALPTSDSSSGVASGVSASMYANPHPYPANMYPGHPSYRGPLPPHHSSPSASLGQGQIMLSQGMVPRSPHSGTGVPTTASGSGLDMRSPLERAVAGVQAHLIALQERMDTLETRVLSGTPYQSRSSLPGVSQRNGNGSPHGSYLGTVGGTTGRDGWSWWEWDDEIFDWEHMGLWSVALSPLARLTKFLMRTLMFLVSRRDREGLPLSPGLVVLRRLLLDASFVLCVLLVGRMGWRRSGLRRREVLRALSGLWGAVAGRSVERVLVERGV